MTCTLVNCILLSLQHRYCHHIIAHTFTARATYPNPDDRKVADAAFSLFDTQKRGCISKEDLAQRCVEIYYDRKHLSQSLAGLDSIMRALKSFANGIMLLLLFFVTLGIFYTSSIGSILLSLLSDVSRIIVEIMPAGSVANKPPLHRSRRPVNYSFGSLNRYSKIAMFSENK